MNDSNDITRLYTLRIAAAYLNLSSEYTRKLCHDGKIPCTKIRNKYFMSSADIKKAQSGNN